ncbi:MAG TPA: peptidoglycan bridge formation glycyltransferase FemA/FemB family protein [Armatimonadota bacterium]|nr:peptidoglycan bridge formation glycyltransferase FemA/FemB family protein [Armatimonadota bacterium]
MLRMNREFRMIENPDPRAWDDFVRAGGGHLLQSAGWGELKSRFGWSALRLALEKDGALVAGAQVLFRRLPLGLCLAYVPRGPVADPSRREICTALIDALSRAAKARGAFALKIEPDRQTGALNWPPSSGLQTFHVERGATIQPQTTIHVDLTPEPDAILAAMKHKWRYNIRLAERKGVRVREGTANDIPRFYQLLEITGVRDRFGIHSLDYYRAAFDLLQVHARLFLAEYEGELLAAIFVTAFGEDGIYLYGASGNAHRERMPNHAVQWAAMQWAKSRGCVRYDLWGIPDLEGKDEENGGGTSARNEGLLPEGLARFKQGFGGKVVRYAGAYDIVFARLKYRIYRQALALRRGGVGQ